MSVDRGDPQYFLIDGQPGTFYLEHDGCVLPTKSERYLTDSFDTGHIILYYDVEKAEWQDSSGWKVKTPDRWKEWL